MIFILFNSLHPGQIRMSADFAEDVVPSFQTGNHTSKMLKLSVLNLERHNYNARPRH